MAEKNQEALVWEELGEEGILAVVKGFYNRVRHDDLLGPMYPDDDWEGAERRLGLFLCFRFGGDPRYQAERGHPRLRARHLPFRIGVLERDRWLTLMGDSLKENQVGESCYDILWGFFEQVADFMRNEEDGPQSSSGGRGIDFGR